jgi:eukaryotic-like serine/threonine-protein kinase
MTAVNGLRNKGALKMHARETALLTGLTKVFAAQIDGEQKLAVPIGTLIAGRYEVRKFIGRGSMADVYQVQDIHTKLVYALKVFEPHTSEEAVCAKQLEHGVIAWKELNHSNIVMVYDVGTTSAGALFFVADLIVGDTLQTLLKREVFLKEERALDIFMQIAEALAYTHSKRQTQGNLKPGNIFLRKTVGGCDIVKISDCGIAKTISQNQLFTMSQLANFVGNPSYLSPEQCKADEPDERSDIYSFGCIMFEALTGYPPFRNLDTIRTMIRHLSEVPRFPSNAKVSHGLRQIILRCLEKDPANRYANADYLLLDLQSLHEGKPIKRRAHRIIFEKFLRGATRLLKRMTDSISNSDFIQPIAVDWVP